MKPMEKACKYDKEADSTRISFFLRFGGKEILRLYRTLTFPRIKERQTNTLKEVLTTYDAHFKKFENVTHASFVFNPLQQAPGEGIKQFFVRVKMQADACKFKDAYDRSIKYRIILGIRDNAL